nr:hypothetical protein [Sinorhizobium medicae]
MRKRQACLQFAQYRLRLRVVQPRERVARLHTFAFAVALLDDPLAHGRRYLGPDAGLYNAAGIDYLRGITTLWGHD